MKHVSAILEILHVMAYSFALYKSVKVVINFIHKIWQVSRVGSSERAGVYTQTCDTL